MNYSSAIFLVNPAARGIYVSYEVDAEGKGIRPFYLFKSLDASIEIGDYVTIPTDTRHKLTVARVEETISADDVDLNSPVELKWIVGPVDRTSYDAVLASEAEAIVRIKSAEKRRQREELADKLRADNPELSSLSAIDFGATANAALPAPPVAS